jgi:hypothetical protein
MLFLALLQAIAGAGLSQGKYHYGPVRASQKFPGIFPETICTGQLIKVKL